MTDRFNFLSSGDIVNPGANDVAETILGVSEYVSSATYGQPQFKTALDTEWRGRVIANTTSMDWRVLNLVG
jgi:hypothetical protein